MIKHKITDFKHFQLPTVILQKNFSGMMEELEKVPDWTATGIT
jgi:hypothetical protein